LLVSCRPEVAGDVLAVFKRHGFGSAAVIGETSAATGKPGLVVR
jgi:hypothetical protein